MPNDLLDRMWKEVKDNTNASEQYRRKCLANIGSLWRGWKSPVKRNYYTKFGTDEERLAITPSRVIREQREILVKYWNTDMARNIASKNKTNCAQQGLFHKTDRTPFSEVRNQPVTWVDYVSNGSNFGAQRFAWFVQCVFFVSVAIFDA
ncbi:hypothetical protein ACOSP7_020424 [Xanthoceras sorbifolium]